MPFRDLGFNFTYYYFINSLVCDGKGTAVLGDGEIFAGLLTEVVATGAGICDKALTRRLNHVANIRNEH